MDDVLFSQKKQLGIITLNRPKALNALTLPMIKAIYSQLKKWQTEDEIQAIIIMAQPGKAFCAGGDVRWLYEAGKERHSQQLEFFEHEYRLNYFIQQYPKPYIALMDGMTMGGGVGISLHGSHPVASERFNFAMPETGIGFFPDIGASYLLARCPNNSGTYLGLTGDKFDAEQALKAGLVNYKVDSVQMPVLMNELAAMDLSKDAHHRVSQCIDKFALTPIDFIINEQQMLIDECFSESSVQSILNCLKTRKEKITDDIYTHLSKKSPLSLTITLEQIHKAEDLDLAACLKMDYTLVKHFMRGHDFYEGVRALLIDKDKAPYWQPKSLNEVSGAMVADYFSEDGVELSLFP